jgi:protein SCO1/2
MRTKAERLASLLIACLAASAVGADDTRAAYQPLPAFDRVMTLAEPRTVRNLPMIDHTGAPRALGDFAGRPVLVFFGFTHCPDVCPTTIQKLALLKASRAGELADVRVVLISVDGERDSPAVLKAFLARFSTEFVGLTAPAAQVRELAAGFSAPFFKDPPRDGTYGVQHSTRVYALDKRGRLRAEMYDASPDAITGVARALMSE